MFLLVKFIHLVKLNKNCLYIKIGIYIKEYVNKDYIQGRREGKATKATYAIV